MGPAFGRRCIPAGGVAPPSNTPGILRRRARLARRDDGEYREYLTEEQRRQPGCIAGRMPAPFMRWVLELFGQQALDDGRHIVPRVTVELAARLARKARVRAAHAT